MKRIIIMACYIPHGEIEEFKKKLIEVVSTYADFFIIVSNGAVSEQTYSFIKEKSSMVLMRDNIGYDAGAYKDAIAGLDLEGYDELLLLNDTFYGFFYSLDEFFDKTQQIQKVDFWGLTRHPEGVCSKDNIAQHIQGYFLLIKSRMLHSNMFRAFWNDLRYPLSYSEAIQNFEVRFTTFFQEHGFRGQAYCNLEAIEIETEFNENPYLKYPYELIKDLRYPVLKRKSCCVGNSSVWKALKYIRENNLYDVKLIFEQLLLDYRDGVISAYFNLYDLEVFLHKYGKIYIYGKGRYGLEIYEYLTIREMTVEKFIVSNKEGHRDDNTIELSELPKGSDYGIILALKPQFANEVLEKLLDKVPIGQLFLGKQ